MCEADKKNVRGRLWSLGGRRQIVRTTPASENWPAELFE
jgi:hypothetical protein